MKILIISLFLSAASFAWAGSGHDMATVNVNGMVCDMCAQGIKKQFKENAMTEVDLDKKTVTLHFKDGKTLDDQQIKEKLKDAGYDVTAIQRSKMEG